MSAQGAGISAALCRLRFEPPGVDPVMDTNSGFVAGSQRRMAVGIYRIDLVQPRPPRSTLILASYSPFNSTGGGIVLRSLSVVLGLRLYDSAGALADGDGLCSIELRAVPFFHE